MDHNDYHVDHNNWPIVGMAHNDYDLSVGMSVTVGEMSATVGGMSATVEEMSATVGKMSATVGEMSATVGGGGGCLQQWGN